MTGWGCRRPGTLLPLLLGAQCFGLDNLANELVNGPLVTRPASPQPIWEIPLKAQSLLALPPAVTAGGSDLVTWAPCIKLITQRNRWPTPGGRVHLGH